MSESLGSVICTLTRCSWEVFTNGTAYRDVTGAGGSPHCAYRKQNGKWTTHLVHNDLHLDVSDKLEELFSRGISAMIVGGPVDPLRHLRRK